MNGSSAWANYDKPREEVTAAEKEASLRYQIMDRVDQANWYPGFGYDREMDWLRNMHDWMISKKRYYGLALPIWICDDCGHLHVIGDENELENGPIEGWETFAGHTPHRPYIDAVKIACSECGGTASRIADVGNPWLDAGIVGFSTMQLPLEQGILGKMVPGGLDLGEFPRPVPQLVLQLPGAEHRARRRAPLLQSFRLCDAAG